MRTLNMFQGSKEWHAERSRRFTASEAPAMMGASKYQSRDKLLYQKATGIGREVTDAEQALFDRGHRAEAAARRIVEDMLGQDLYPVTAVSDKDDRLLASLDGCTLDETTLYEHKLWSEGLAAQVRARDLEPHYYWQLEQQLLVAGAEKVIFVCSDGTPEKFASMEYRPVPGRDKALLAGWDQFAADLAAYEPPAVAAPKATGRTPENLPALLIEVTGQVTASNLREYKEHALAVFAGINRNLATDQDFADAEQAVKWCADVESRLAAAKQHALSQTASIDELFRTVDEISAEARRVRLDLDKLVKAEKEARRAEIVRRAHMALNEHVSALNIRIGKYYMPGMAVDFAGAIKGKKSLDSMRSAVNDELARAKIAANEVADRITVNLRTLAEHAEHASLFPDTATLALKTPDDLLAIIKARVSDHQAAEAKKAEAAAQAQQSIQQAAAPAAAPAAPAPAPWDTDEAPTLKLGDVNARLAPIHVTADGLRSIGIEPAGREKNATLYRESQFAGLCDAIARRAMEAKRAALLPT